MGRALDGVASPMSSSLRMGQPDRAVPIPIKLKRSDSEQLAGMRTRIETRYWLPALAGLVALTGCNAGADEPTPDTGDFAFESVLELDLGVTVRRSGQLAEGVVVTVVDPITAAADSLDSAALASAVVHGRGVTDEEGRVETTVAVPADRIAVDVIVEAPGARGPYSREDLRTLWGPMAPAARLTVGPGALASLTFDLEEAP